ncbi:MAG: hypothetical protein HQM03_01785 [Magnetococcales bacterium]|nr:hypothetical protein [Magnetococcales bacterium]
MSEAAFSIIQSLTRPQEGATPTGSDERERAETATGVYFHDFLQAVNPRHEEMPPSARQEQFHAPTQPHAEAGKPGWTLFAPTSAQVVETPERAMAQGYRIYARSTHAVVEPRQETTPPEQPEQRLDLRF